MNNGRPLYTTYIALLKVRSLQHCALSSSTYLQLTLLYRWCLPTQIKDAKMCDAGAICSKSAVWKVGDCSFSQNLNVCKRILMVKSKCRQPKRMKNSFSELVVPQFEIPNCMLDSISSIATRICQWRTYSGKCSVCLWPHTQPRTKIVRI